jgi:hypothetical protein
MVLLHDFSEIVKISTMGNPYSTNGLRRKTKQIFQKMCFMKGTAEGRNIYIYIYIAEDDINKTDLRERISGGSNAESCLNIRVEPWGSIARQSISQ